MKKRLKKKRANRAWYRHATILSFMLNRPINSLMPTGRWSRHEAKAWWNMRKVFFKLSIPRKTDISPRCVQDVVFEEYQGKPYIIGVDLAADAGYDVFRKGE